MSKLRYGIAAASVLAPALVGVASVSAYSSSPTTVDGLVVDNEAKTINLTKDVSACLDFTSGDNYTLNLGNFSLTAKDDSCTPIMLNGGTLTITGDKSGQITNTSSSVSALVNNVAGNLTINSGNFVQNGLNSAILASGSGSTKIYGGYFRNADTDNDAGVVATTGEAGATVTISGGTFIADEYEYVIVDDALSSTKLNNFSITGGDFVGVVYFTGEAFISGGTFDTDPDEADFYNFNRK